MEEGIRKEIEPEIKLQRFIYKRELIKQQVSGKKKKKITNTFTEGKIFCGREE